MANVCTFQMMITGNKDGIEKFYKALTQASTDAWMGRGADASIEYENDSTAYVDGDCKWSIQSALIDNAESMQEQKDNDGDGDWYWDEEASQVKEFLTIWEACEKYHVNMEAFSWEPGEQFSEHYKYENGEITDECVDYSQEYDEEEDDYIEIGGFEVDFNLAMPA